MLHTRHPSAGSSRSQRDPRVHSLLKLSFVRFLASFLSRPPLLFFFLAPRRMHANALSSLASHPPSMHPFMQLPHRATPFSASCIAATSLNEAILDATRATASFDGSRRAGVPSCWFRFVYGVLNEMPLSNVRLRNWRSGVDRIFNVDQTNLSLRNATSSFFCILKVEVIFL